MGHYAIYYDPSIVISIRCLAHFVPDRFSWVISVLLRNRGHLSYLRGYMHHHKTCKPCIQLDFFMIKKLLFHHIHYLLHFPSSMPTKLNHDCNHIFHLLMDIVRGIEQIGNFVSNTIHLCMCIFSSIFTLLWFFVYRKFINQIIKTIQ